MSKFRYDCPDYEHRGDLDRDIAYLKCLCSQMSNINAQEERDYEAEADYEQEYGELDENIYRGYIEFEAPESYTKILITAGCYEN